MKRYYLILSLIILFISCKKDEETVTGPDLFIGSYTGIRTTMVIANGEFIEFSEIPITKTIEESTLLNGLILGKGTDMEFNASVDGSIFLIPGHSKHFVLENSGVDINFSITGQGLWNKEKKLAITYGSYEKIDNTEYKLTIAETLTKVEE